MGGADGPGVDRRELYRVDLREDERGLSVAVETAQGHKIEAQLVDLSRKGLALRIPADRAPDVAAREQLWLHFRDPGDRPIAPLRAMVRSVIGTPGFVRYGLRFDPDQDLSQVLPEDLLPRFNQRVARRIRPREEIAIELRPGDDGRAVVGRVRDLSWSGLGASIPAQAHASPLDGARDVELRFELPGIRRPLCLRGRIQRDLLIDDRVCYGIRFDPVLSEDFVGQQNAIKRYVARCFIEHKQERARARIAKAAARASAKRTTDS